MKQDMTRYEFIADYNAQYKAAIRPDAEIKTKQYKKGDVIHGKSFDGGKTISTNINGTYPQDEIMGVALIAIPISVLKGTEIKRYEAPRGKYEIPNDPQLKRMNDFKFQPNPYIIGIGAGGGLLLGGLVAFFSGKRGGTLAGIIIASAIAGGGVGTVVNYTMQLRTDNKNRQ